MDKIMVIGVSAGAGKSTFAKELGRALKIEVYHLDAMFWKPGWVEASFEEFAAPQRKIVQTSNQWIMEGNYSKTYDIRAEYADTIVYLEHPLYLCLFRVMKRWLKNRGKTRPDLGEGCPDKLDWDFIRFICTTYYPRKRNMQARFRYFQTLGSKKSIHILKGKKEISSFLKDIH
ncbi:topology modulation protein [Virgibacillus phasianinus]|uniref:Topology modulation protein n=1 Tax=Virgibacillus phasianinus TaxID=2017483 RepID=A0A220U709_9BACI|nr:topology modulation protein [Virgibacillus phasianinus]ASK63907.1 topology modulation protein [Virgibacillus phasianinus]